MASLAEGCQTGVKLLWTDYKNLEYISTTRSVNSRVACWDLFTFAYFNFSLYFHAGSRTLSLIPCLTSS